jgi:D-alanyl-D-alanine carboxypeptidase/D-alanyl-D-alanine-endopeptidase (penicillin-binding protein 4)
VTLGFAASAGSSATPPAVPADIQAVFDKPMYRNATWGFRVEDGSKVIVDLNSSRHFYIGSVRKVFSVGALLNRVGGTHTYDTPVYRTGTVDASRVLHGNLVVLASGDLTMGGRTNPDGTVAVSKWDHNEANGLGNAILTKPDPLAGYLRLARAVKAAGIDRVAGEVVIDDRLFVPFEFRDEFKVRPIFVNDDLVDVSIVPARQPGPQQNVTSRPKSAALAVNNGLVAGAADSKDTLKVDPFLPQCIGSPGCASALTGSLPVNFVPPLTNEPVLVQAVRVVQPSSYARTVFIEALASAGVQGDATAVEANPVRLLPAKGSYRAAAKVAQLTGLSYGQDAKFILKISYNIGADTSLVLDGLTHDVDTMTDALRVEQGTLATKYGVARTQYHFIDGSGGGDTWATNGAVTHMLDELAKAPERQAFLDALPVLGVDGSIASLKEYRRDASLAGATGRVRAKTGTWVAGADSGIVLKGQALGGYITTKSGKHLTFELVVNNVPITGIPDIINVFEDEGLVSAILWRDY